MEDIGKIISDAVKSAGKDIKFRVSDAKVKGIIIQDSFMTVDLDYVVSPAIDKPLKIRHPLGIRTHDKIMAPIRKIKFDKWSLEIFSIGKRKNVDGIKHKLKYKFNVENEIMELEEKPVKQEVKKIPEPETVKDKTEAKDGKD